MTVLILCVDRDNDLGEKTNTDTPLIGRKACLEAVNSFALADPEDSDVNSIFAAISVLDNHRKQDIEAEIAVICGDKNVGIVSDKIIASQLDSILETIKPTSCILISDGAEDENIFPILASRIKIDSVKRVVVKQSQNIESTFYLITKVMKEEKIQRKFIIPVALALAVFSMLTILTAIAGIRDIGFPAMLFTISMYLLVRAFHLENTLVSAFDDIKKSFIEGNWASLTFMTFAGLVWLVGLVRSFEIIIPYIGKPIVMYDFLILEMTVIVASLWWYIFAAIISAVGGIINDFLKDGAFSSPDVTTIVPMIASGFIVLGIMDAMFIVLGVHSTDRVYLIVMQWAIGIFMALIGTYITGYVKKHLPKEDDEEEGEKGKKFRPTEVEEKEGREIAAGVEPVAE